MVKMWDTADVCVCGHSHQMHRHFNNASYCGACGVQKCDAYKRLLPSRWRRLLGRLSGR